jgi:hypothetical protein
MATAALAAEGSQEDRRDLGPLFVGTIFVGSFLLFLVQPMIARMALPRLGGAPAVWNSAMLVYQALLLGGYAYAHALSRLNIRNQSFVHLVLLAAAALLLPIGLSDRAMISGLTPALAVPLLLLLSIGPLFFAVSAQAPLIQRWYAAATGGRDPYPLYAASNFGSFAGLISYPLLVEPRMALAGQSGLWTIGYVLLVVMTLACAWVLPRAGLDTSEAGFSAEPAPSFRTRLWWVVLAFVPSGMMLSTTTYLTTDIVAMPLLWVIPLGLYLLSFTLAFGEGRGVVVSICRLSPVVILTVGGLSLQNAPAQPLLVMISILMLLFTVAVTLHAEMYRTRPDPRHLTGFYLCMSIGGALGGIFSGLIAPLVFDWTYEHTILMLLGGALVPQAFLIPGAEALWSGSRARRLVQILIYTLIVAAIAYATIERPWPWLYGNGAMIGAAAIGFLTLFCIGYRPAYLIGLVAMALIFGGWDALQKSLEPGARMRSYFGIYTIRDSGDTRILAHGTTQHGLQITTRGRERELTTYYSPYSGVGQALFKVPGVYGPNARIGAVGLGTGTLACYTRPGQSWTFYEIDPMMIEVARNGGKFSYLARCNPNVPIVLGDARLSLAGAQPASLDFLVLDAFSSDAVPMHMLTREAFAIFGRVLQPRGMLLVHISNRFLDLEPVVAVAAREGGWHAARYDDRIAADDEAYRYISSSNWVLMTRDPQLLARVTSDPPPGGKWRPLRADPDFAGWSDDYGSILPLLKAFR